MEINWTVLTYFVIGLFALSGFFKGWWKEAITTIFLAILVFFLQMPNVAKTVIDLINLVISTLTGLLPDAYNTLLMDFLEGNLGIRTVSATVQIDANDGGAWLIILILFVGISVLISRLSLPNGYRARPPYARYDVTPLGSLLGGLVGGVNGLLIISLIREYLNGSHLPGGRPAEAIASAGTSLQAVELPVVTILDSFLPWIFIGIGFFVFLAAMKSRIKLLQDRNGFRKIDFRAPFGHAKIPIKKS